MATILKNIQDLKNVLDASNSSYSIEDDILTFGSHTTWYMLRFAAATGEFGSLTIKRLFNLNGATPFSVESVELLDNGLLFQGREFDVIVKNY